MSQAQCGMCLNFRVLPPMGPGWPPYDCGIKTFHATWYDRLACDDFNPKAGFQHLSKAYIEKERLNKERLEKERLKKEHLEKERSEKVRLECEASEKERLQLERVNREQAEQERVKREGVGLASGKENRNGNTYTWFRSSHTGKLRIDFELAVPTMVRLLDELNFNNYMKGSEYTYYGGDLSTGLNTIRVQGNSRFFVITKPLLFIPNVSTSITFKYYNWW